MKRHLENALNQFAEGMAIAERARAVLKSRYGFTDQQIGRITLQRQRRTPMQQLAAATLAAKQKLNAKARKQP
jgi:exonuclease VII small subunit